MELALRKIDFGTVLVSLLFAIVCAVLAYNHMDYPLVYTDFTASRITWRGEGKTRDVSLVFTFMVVFSLSLITLYKLQTWIKNNYDIKAVECFSIVLMCASIPFVIWSGEQVLSKQIPNYDLLFFNSWIIAGGIISTFIILNFQLNKDKDISKLIVFSFVIFTFATLSPNVLSAIANRLGRDEVLSNTLLVYGWLIFPIAWFLSLYLFKDKIKYYQYSVLLFQIIIVGYFILLIPSPYRVKGDITFFPIQTSLYILTASIILYSIFDIFKRYKINRNLDELSFSLLSPFPFAALLILIFFSVTSMPVVNPDDYHFGEKLLPFYIISKYNAIPYVDYSLAHGFLNDVIPSLGSSLFLDGTASTLGEGKRILLSLLFIGFFLFFYRTLGLMVAFILSVILLSLSMKWLLIYTWLVAISIMLMKINVRKIGGFFPIISLVTIILIPAQGMVFILSILPLVIYRVISTKTFIFNLKNVGFLLVTLMLVMIAVPWIYNMFFSAARYVLENGLINFQAYGIAWEQSWNSSRTLNSSLMVYEVIRTSWIFIPIIVLCFWILNYYKDNDKKIFLYSLFTVFFVLLMYKYSLGRIGPFTLSRLGVVSLGAIPMLFLSIYFMGFSKQRFVYWTLFLVFWMGLLTPNNLRDTINYLKRPVPNITGLTNGEDIGIPRLGYGKTNAKHIDRILVIKEITDKFLEKDETFLDITNRSALYFYLDRYMPIEATPYNQPHQAMQQRSVDRLSKAPPPMALLKASNINWDGKTLSIRAYHIYRWVMQNYIPVSMKNNDSIIIGIHKNKLNSFAKRFPRYSIPSSIEERNRLWGYIFVLKDLKHLPISWGKSQGTLNKKIEKIEGIDFTPRSIHWLKNVGVDKYKVIGNTPYIKYDISAKNLSGGNAGMLSFDFIASDSRKNPVVKVYWIADGYGVSEAASVKFNVHNGRVIVPLDVAPRWMTAKHIKTVRIAIENIEEGQVFSIKNISLGQRILGDE